MADTSIPRTEDGPNTSSVASKAPLHPLALGPVLGIAGVAGASVLAGALRYGFHRDELYFIAAGRRLDTGYVDQPLLTPLLSRLADDAFGQSLFGVRSVAAVLVVLGVLATALLARELGGSRTAQLLAAFTAAAAPILRGTNTFLGTTGVDQLTWAVAFVLAARLLRTGNPRYWIAIGVAIGVGLEAKTTILLLAIGLMVGVLAERRWDLVRSGWLVAGVVIAVVLWAPNLAWHAAHDWAMVVFIRGKPSGFGDVGGYAYFLVATLLLSGITTVFVWFPGWRWLLERDGRGRTFRPLGIAAVVVVGTLFVVDAKYYYASPVFLLLFAAGAVALEAGLPRPRIVATWLVAASIVLCAPMTLPLLPAGELATVDAYNRDFSSMVGWPELAEQVQAVAATVPPDQQDELVVLTANYGEAGALEYFAPELSVYSGHNNYWWWGPPPDSAVPVILVGFDPQSAGRLCPAPEDRGIVSNDAGLDNHESRQHIYVCRELREPWSTNWPNLRYYG